MLELTVVDGDGILGVSCNAKSTVSGSVAYKAIDALRGSLFRFKYCGVTSLG